MDDEDTSKTSPPEDGDARSIRLAKRRGGNPAQSPAVTKKSPTKSSTNKQHKSATAKKKSIKKKTQSKKLLSEERNKKGYALSLAIRDVVIKHGVHPSFYGSLLDDKRKRTHREFLSDCVDNMKPKNDYTACGMSFSDKGDPILPSTDRNDGLSYKTPLVVLGSKVSGMYLKKDPFPKATFDYYKSSVQDISRLRHVAIQCPQCKMKFVTSGTIVSLGMRHLQGRRRTAGDFLNLPLWTEKKDSDQSRKKKGHVSTMDKINKADCDYVIPMAEIQTLTKKVWGHWHRYTTDSYTEPKEQHDIADVPSIYWRHAESVKNAWMSIEEKSKTGSGDYNHGKSEES